MHIARSLRGSLVLLPALLAAALAYAILPALAAVPALPAETIQHQIETAPDGGSILVPSGFHYESVTINKSLTVTALSSATTIIQAVAGQRVINVTPGHTVTLKNLTIQSGNVMPGGVGGGILMGAGGDLRIISCRIIGNAADYGGGLFADGASNRVDIIGSTFEENVSTMDGGALWVRGSVALTDTHAFTNTAGRHGGALHAQDGAILRGGLLASNRADGGNGGAVNVNNGIAVSGTRFISNSASVDGGALLQWNTGQILMLSGARFERNGSGRDGGALWARGSLTVTGGVFVTNSAFVSGSTSTRGGAI